MDKNPKLIVYGLAVVILALTATAIYLAVMILTYP